MRRQDRQRVADLELAARPDRIRAGRRDPAAPRSASCGPEAVALGRQVAHDALVHVDPAWIELDADGPPRTAGDGRPEQRAADPGERVERRARRSD